MSTLAERLKIFYLFSELSDVVREQVAALCRRRTYDGRTQLFHRGDTGGLVYFVLQGGVKLYCEADNGQETTLAILSAGDFFGEMGFLTGKRSASAVTLTGDAELLTLDRSEFYRVLHDNFDVTYRLLGYLAFRLEETNRRLTERRDTSLCRLAKLLLACADPCTGQLQPPMTQEDIASLIGTTRETVARNLKTLEQSRLLARNRGNLLLLNRPALERRLQTS